MDSTLQNKASGSQYTGQTSFNFWHHRFQCEKPTVSMSETNGISE